MAKNRAVATSSQRQIRDDFREGVAQAGRMMLLEGATEVYLQTTEAILGDVKPATSARCSHENSPGRSGGEGISVIPNRSIVTSAQMQATDKMGGVVATALCRDFHVGEPRAFMGGRQRIPNLCRRDPMQSIYTLRSLCG